MTAGPYDIGAPNRVKIQVLAEAQNWRCAYCGILCHGTGNDWDAPSRDHVVPVVAYGLHVWENEIMACRLCNNGRGAMYARAYWQRVKWMGRAKAFKWAMKKRQRHAAAKATHKLRSAHA